MQFIDYMILIIILACAVLSIKFIIRQGKKYNCIGCGSSCCQSIKQCKNCASRNPNGK